MTRLHQEVKTQRHPCKELRDKAAAVDDHQEELEGEEEDVVQMDAEWSNSNRSHHPEELLPKEVLVLSL